MFLLLYVGIILFLLMGYWAKEYLRYQKYPLNDLYKLHTFYNIWQFVELYNTWEPATVAQHVAHPLVVGKVIGSNLGPTPRHN